ncbi:MAG: LemA family protein [Verrucomicrobia bacterium]|nr:LemA family protein [Verrucomicrobiota bacterium]
MNADAPWWLWVVGGGLAVLFLGLAIRAGRRLRFLIDTPTSKAKGVFIGQVELAGRAAIDQPVTSYLAGAATVWFRFAVDEEWERWETETYTDSKGRTQTRTVRKTGWQTVAQGGETPPFFVTDDTGAVLIQPKGASIEPVSLFSETVGPGDALYYAKGPAQEIADSNHRRRFIEEGIPVGTALFVAGRARERNEVVAPEIAADPAAEMFLISCRSEAKVQRGYRVQFWLLGLLAVAPLPVVALIAVPGPERLRILLPVGLGVGIILLWAFAWLWMSFNSLVQLRNRADQAWSLVDVQLKRRADLIPRLVAVVTGLRDHERHVQTEVATLRAQAQATPAWEPGPDVAGVTPTLRAVMERYPELKSDAAFLGLQRELSDTETRVALARDYFNEIATHQNTRLEIIPDRWLAPLAGLKPRPLLVGEAFERAPVTVKLG